MGYDVHVKSINRAKMKERTKNLSKQEILENYFYITEDISYDVFDESNALLYNIIQSLGYTVENDGYLEITEELFNQIKEAAGDKRVSDFLKKGSDWYQDLMNYVSLLEFLQKDINFKENILIFDHDS